MVLLSLRDLGLGDKNLDLGVRKVKMKSMADHGFRPENDLIMILRFLLGHVSPKSLTNFARVVVEGCIYGE